jgi:hypothetical protein
MKMVAVLVCVFADGQKESHENEIVLPFVTNFQGKAEPIEIAGVKPPSRNARTHSKKQIRQIASKS